MRTTLKARNFELGDRLRLQIDRKLRRLERVSHPQAEATVELIQHASRDADTAHVAEAILVNDGAVVRSTAAAKTPIAAVDGMLDKLERQVIRARQKARAPRGRPDDRDDALARGVSVETPSEPRRGVVVTKRFDMVPMFPEDAIERMEELGHAFFLFLNAESETICLVYRRADGSHGLIEPVVDRRR